MNRMVALCHSFTTKCFCVCRSMEAYFIGTCTGYYCDMPWILLLQITVLVVDVNDNPPIFSPRYYAAAVLECSLIGTTVNVVYATDADATPINRIIIYTIVSGNPYSKSCDLMGM